MPPLWMTLAAVGLQIAVSVVLLVFSIRLIRESGKSITAVFFAFTIALWLLTDLYWVIYDLMRPDSLMPFAANEIGEAAAFLMIAAVLSSVISHGAYKACLQGAGAILFSVCNAALWIAWSGEWIQDMMIGASFTFLLYTLARCLKARYALSRGEWIGLGVGCALLVLGEGLTFVVSDGLKMAIDTGCSLLMTAGVIFWMWKNGKAWKNKAAPDILLCLSFALLCWAVTSKYLSAGVWYLAFMTVETVTMPFVFLSVRKAVAVE